MNTKHHAPSLLEELSWRHAIGFLALGILWAIWHWSLPSSRPPGTPGLKFLTGNPSYIAALINYFLLQLTPIVVFVILADTIREHPRLRMAALCLAAVAGVAVVKPLTCALSPTLEPSLCVDSSSLTPNWWLWKQWWHFLTNILFMLVYFNRREALRIGQALRAAEAAAALNRRERLENELQALQARAEPSLLFESLARVRAAYEARPDEGERLLDSLIVYLRKALPTDPGTGSTLTRERELLCAWLDVQGLPVDASLRSATRPELAQASLPPMLLVPLAMRLAVEREGPIAMTAEASGGKLRVMLALRGNARGGKIAGMPEPFDSEAMERELRGRLAALFGSDARLVFNSPEQESVSAVLEIPHELA